MRGCRGQADLLTFPRFVALPENQFALSAVRQVAACVTSGRPSRVLNPLVLHGPSGTGKTHLVGALVDDVCRKAPQLSAAVFAAGDIAESPEDQSNEEVVAPNALWDADLLI